MTFKAHLTKSGRLPMIRGNEADYLALKKQATKAGITPSEAVRQLLEAYLATPFTLSADVLTLGLKNRSWPSLRAKPALVEGITKASQEAGITVTEAIRQIVRRHLLIDSKGDVK